MFDPWAWIRRARKLLLCLVAILAILGVWSYLNAPKSIFPQVSFSRIEIFAWAGDLPPEEMLAMVTRPLEAALQTLPVLQTRSFSNQGTVEIELDFDPGSDPEADLLKVQAVIAAARPSLSAVTRIETVIQHPNMEPIVTYALTSASLTQAELRHAVEQRVVPVFTGTAGLGRITVFGGPDVEYRVTLDPDALAKAGITDGEVAEAIGQANAAHAAGTIDLQDQSKVVFVGGSLTDATSLSNVAILDRNTNASVPLSHLGRVELGEGPTLQQASFDAAHAVLVSAYPVIGADSLSLRRDLETRVSGLKDGLPPDVRIAKYWDQTRLIVASQQSLRDAILLGALIALLVIYVFLRGLGMTLVAAAVIPVAIAITILIIEQAGMFLSLMSLGGLAVAVGLIIDEVIVVIESIARGLAEFPDLPRGAVISRATGRIARALIASTAANVVVFLPLGLLTGIPGFFFRALAITLGVALVVSIILSLGVAPMLTELFLRPAEARRRGLFAVEALYTRLLGWALRHRLAVYFAALTILGATAALYPQLESDFLPRLEEGEFEIAYTLPPGTSLSATDRVLTAIEKIIVADPAVAHEGRLTGVDTDGYEPTPRNAGTIRVSLRESGTAKFEQVADRLRDAFDKAVPGADLEFHQLLEDQLNDLSGAPEPIQIEITGPDQARLISISHVLMHGLNRIDGLVDTFDGVVVDNQIVRVTLKPDDPAGMSAAELSDALGARIAGVVATRIRDGDTTIPVRVGVGAEPGDSLDALGIATRSGTRSLGSMASIGAPTWSTEIFERNGARRLLLTSDIEDVTLSAVIPKIQAVVAKVRLPAGYHVSIGGAYQEQQASFREFSRVLGIAVLLVFLVLLAAFNSFRIPLIILATIPLSPIGVLLALWLTGTPINVSSFMGLLLLVGIVVRNGILLIDAANRRRQEGAPLTEALLGAGTERLRPILMTTFAAIGALLPLAVGFGSGSEMLIPLAIGVIGGLSTATAFTLVLIPVLYAAYAGDGRS
ncbi:MAG TPA: efflux RND transporter permease subunit [Candidatus Udaeobacter sp.]|nr:efflux RND transporter permease subunit [Candidatus Udaeobacter sp.]